MQSDRELMQQALEALESGDWYIGQLEPFVYSAEDTGTHEERAKVQAAIVALRERLAQPEFDSALQSAAMTQTAPKLAQPEQKRPQMRRATREEKIDRPGVYWVPVNNIANSEVIPEQISGPKQEPPNLNCKSVQARLAAQWGYVKAEQEPVAWMIWTQGPVSTFLKKYEAEVEFDRLNRQYPEPSRKLLALYTTPPRREWVGLTDKEIAEAGKLWVEGERMLPFAFANAIEAKLREKNS